MTNTTTKASIPGLYPTVLCSISTRGRYETSLPLAIQAVIMQTRKVDKLIIFDDNDEPKDLRENQMYQYMFSVMNLKGIAWEWVFAGRKGQHHNHQMANMKGFDWVWRVDDDCIPEPGVLQTLYNYATAGPYVGTPVGAVGGAILTPPYADVGKPTGRIEDIDREQNIQWNPPTRIHDVDHLHCSFLYRAGVHDYNLGLSRVAHREETLFTYGLKQKGYALLIVPGATSWHLKNRQGGIRMEQKELFDHDEQIFRNFLALAKPADTPSVTVVVLDNGMGDHIVFKSILDQGLIPNPMIFSCYPDIIPGRSIQEAKNMLGDIEPYNIYRKMDQWKWTDSLQNAFKKLYGVPL